VPPNQRPPEVDPARDRGPLGLLQLLPHALLPGKRSDMKTLHRSQTRAARKARKAQCRRLNGDWMRKLAAFSRWKYENPINYL